MNICHPCELCSDNSRLFGANRQIQVRLKLTFDLFLQKCTHYRYHQNSLYDTINQSVDDTVGLLRGRTANFITPHYHMIIGKANGRWIYSFITEYSTVVRSMMNTENDRMVWYLKFYIVIKWCDQLQLCKSFLPYVRNSLILFYYKKYNF